MEAPQVEFIFEESTIIDLDACGSVLAAFEFEVFAVDNCTDTLDVEVAAAEQVQLKALGNGRYLALLPVGAQRIDVTATDEAGLSTTEMLLVQVNRRPSSDGACAGDLSLLLDQQCIQELRAEEVLLGALCGSIDDYLVTVLDDNPENGGVIDFPGTYTYSVGRGALDPVSGFSGFLAPENWTLAGRGQFAEGRLLLDSAAATLAIPEAGQVAMDFGSAGSGDLRIELVDANGVVIYDTLVIFTSLQVEFDVPSNLQLLLTTESGPTAVESISYLPARQEQTPVCWGTVTAKDNSSFDVPCPADVSTATITTQGQEFANNLSFAPFGLQASAFSCLQSDIETVPGPQRYRTYSFTVDKADRYTFALKSTWGNGIGALYAGNFQFQRPCENILAIGGRYLHGDDDQPDAGDPVLYLSTFLEPGESYTLLTIGNTSSVPGDYEWEIISDNGGRIVQLPVVSVTTTRPLIFNDLERLQIPNGLPRCYRLDGNGDVIVPADPAEAQQLQKLLDILAITGFPGDASTGQIGGCDELEVCVSERLSTAGDCDEQVLLRSFRITGDRGQFKLCEQRIIARPPTLADVILPPSTGTVECDENFPTLDNGNPSPLATGGPRIATVGGVLPLDEGYATINVQFEDKVRIPICDGSFKFVREWTIIDWCDPAASRTFMQVVQVKDKTPPTIKFGKPGESNSAGNQSIITGGNDCAATLRLNTPTLTDACGSVTYTTEVRAFVSGVDSLFAFIGAEDTSRFVFGLPVGNYRVVYTATDDCGNSATDIRSLSIRDGSTPNAIARGPLQVSLFTDNDTRIEAAAFDAGSFDACGPVTISVARQFPCFDSDFFTGFSSIVRFQCCDVGKTIPIVLQARDRFGNTAFDTTAVSVVDKRIPICLPPADTSISCTTLPVNFSPSDTLQLQEFFGQASATGVCGAFVEELLPIINWPNCGSGAIIRRFRANSGVTQASVECTQRIEITEDHAYAIRFPADAEAVCGLPSVDTLRIFEFGCDLLAVSVEDQRVNQVEDACFKVFRKYSVINWCEYDGQSDPVVIGRDEDCDEKPGDEPVWVVVQNDTAFVDRDSLPNNNNPVAAEGNCPNPAGYWRTVPRVGYYEYTQTIKVVDDTPPQVIVGNSFPVCIANDTTCAAEVEVRFTVEETCTPEDLDIEILFDNGHDGVIDADLTQDNPLEGLFPKFVFKADLPLGVHNLKIRVTDACGNVGSADYPLNIVDCKVAAPICINGLTATLGPVTEDSIAAVVSVESLLASPLTDCSGPLEFSINRPGEQPNINQKTITFGCGDIGFQAVEVYAWDKAMNPFKIQPDGTEGGPNFDFCETYILVQDDNEFDFCPGENPIFSLAGTVTDLSGAPVPGINVQFGGARSLDQLTSESGQYQFDSLSIGAPGMIWAQRNVDWREELSALDIVFITQHIIQRSVMSDPLALLVADVNASGTITILDALQLQRIILGSVDTLPHGKSYLFATGELTMDNWMEPTAQEYYFPFLNPELANDRYNFVMAKAGDVSGVINGGAKSGEPRSTEPLSVRALPLEVPGTYRVTIELPTIADWTGIQFAMQWPEGTELLHGPEGQNTSWLWEAGLLKVVDGRASDESDHFQFTIDVRMPAGGNQLPQFASEVLTAEAYDGALRTNRLSLDYQIKQSSVAGVTEAALRLWPNPVSEQFTGAFTSGTANAASELQWRLLDAAGRVVREGRTPLENGSWERIFRRGTDFHQAGTYWLWVQAGDQLLYRAVLVD